MLLLVCFFDQTSQKTKTKINKLFSLQVDMTEY